MENLNGLESLVELNLRRNKVEEVVKKKQQGCRFFFYNFKTRLLLKKKRDLNYCPKLQRLFLSYNELKSLSSLKSLDSLGNLYELCLDNNPVEAVADYKRNILVQVGTTLQKLDTRRVTDEEKRMAEKSYVKELKKKRDEDKLASVEEKKKLAIRDAENEWVRFEKSSSNNKLQQRYFKSQQLISSSSSSSLNGINSNLDDTTSPDTTTTAVDSNNSKILNSRVAFVEPTGGCLFNFIYLF